MKIKYFLPLFLLFSVILVFSITGRNFLVLNGMDAKLLLYGNFLLFAVTGLSLGLLIGGMHAKTTASFLQSVYGSLIGKLFICGIAAFVYFKTAAVLNKPTIFILLGLYLLYSFLEIRSILQLTKELKNAKKTGTT